MADENVDDNVNNPPPADGGQTATPPADGDQNSDGSGDLPAAEVTAPEEYAAFELPDGVEMDQATLERALPVFKEHNLSQEQAQGMANVYADLKQAEAEAYAQQIDDWAASVKADKEIGGDAYDATVANSSRAVDTYGDQELKDLLNSTGLGNHPAVVRFANNVGKQLGEDDPGSGDPVTARRDRQSILYPDKE